MHVSIIILTLLCDFEQILFYSIPPKDVSPTKVTAAVKKTVPKHDDVSSTTGATERKLKIGNYEESELENEDTDTALEPESESPESERSVMEDEEDEGEDHFYKKITTSFSKNFYASSVVTKPSTLTSLNAVQDQDGGKHSPHADDADDDVITAAACLGFKRPRTTTSIHSNHNNHRNHITSDDDSNADDDVTGCGDLLAEGRSPHMDMTDEEAAVV